MNPTRNNVITVCVIAFAAMGVAVYVDNVKQNRMYVETIQLPEQRQVPKPTYRHDRDYIKDCEFSDCEFVAVHEYRENVKRMLDGRTSR